MEDGVHLTLLNSIHCTHTYTHVKHHVDLHNNNNNHLTLTNFYCTNVVYSNRIQQIYLEQGAIHLQKHSLALYRGRLHSNVVRAKQAYTT